MFEVTMTLQYQSSLSRRSLVDMSRPRWGLERSGPEVSGLEPTPLKNMSSSIGMLKFPNIWENKKCSKPPTSLCNICYLAWEFLRLCLLLKKKKYLLLFVGPLKEVYFDSFWSILSSLRLAFDASEIAGNSYNELSSHSIIIFGKPSV